VLGVGRLDALHQDLDALAALERTLQPAVVGGGEEGPDHGLEERHGLAPDVVQGLDGLQHQQRRRHQAPSHHEGRDAVEERDLVVGQRLVIRLQRERVAQPLAELTPADFPLGPRLEADLAGWRRELSEGCGFVLLSGLPVERWGDSVIHARTAYVDERGAGGRRHLLRLWLSL
jgi:hypothetical protein